MEKEMAKALSPTRTVKNTLETIKMVNGPAGAFSHSRMGIRTKAISGMERRMARVPSSIQAEISMKANGKMTKSTARVHLPMRAGEPIRSVEKRSYAWAWQLQLSQWRCVSRRF